jgi:ABC-type nitrate/sulfonate/bicarbonate transport system permease component
MAEPIAGSSRVAAASRAAGELPPLRTVRRRARLRDKLGHLLALLLPAALVAIWELYCRGAKVDPTVLPAPSRIVIQLWDFRGLAATHTLQTVKETAVGFSVSITVAMLVAVVMDQVAWLRRALYPLLVGSQTIPIIAIAPLMIIWFGFGLLPKVLVIVLTTFFPIVVAFLDGFASTDQEAMSLLQTMGASKRQIFRYVRFPTALPYLFTGIRIAATYAVVAAIFAEYVGAYNGLGIWMQLSKNAFRTDLVFAAILITAVLSITLFLLVHVAARLAIPWYYASRKRAT